MKPKNQYPNKDMNTQLRRLILIILVFFFVSLGVDDVKTHLELSRLNRTFMELVLNQTPHSLRYEIPKPHFQRTADETSTKTPIEAPQPAPKNSDTK